MSKNNQQPRMVLERKNFKLYKAKKQWVTACATVLVTLGATAFVNASANADPNSTLTEPVTKEAVATVQSGMRIKTKLRQQLTKLILILHPYPKMQGRRFQLIV